MFREVTIGLAECEMDLRSSYVQAGGRLACDLGVWSLSAAIKHTECAWVRGRE